VFDLLGPEQQEFRQTLRRFAREQIMPSAAQRDEDAEYPHELVAGLAQMGLMGITVPEDHGGLGLDMVSQVLAIEEIAYADASLGSVFAGHYLGLECINGFGSAEQKTEYLPRLATGEVRMAFALTEPDAGSDIGGMRTVAVRRGEEWCLSGGKTFISNAREAKFVIVFAKTDPSAGVRGISAFIVPTDAPGLTFGSPIRKLGIRGEHAYELFIDDVLVGADALLGDEGGGARIALGVLNSARIDVAALANGVAMRALDLAVGYASSRVQFGGPIRDLQAIQLSLAKIDAMVQSGRLSAYHAATLRDNGRDVRRAGSIAKYVASENCFLAVDQALQVHGGYGYVKESEIERLYRDCRVFRIYEGTSEIQLVTIAKLLSSTWDKNGTVV
jgi:acyl-CoA dehydrogenase